MSDISLPDALGFLVRVTDDAGKVLGTGIAVAPGYVLTSLHAVGPRMLADPDDGLWVVRAGGRRLPAVLTYADGELDLAMVRCVELAGPAGRFLSSRHVEVGRRVEVVAPSPASDERLVLIDGIWQGHGYVAAARWPPGLGIGGSPVVLPADGSVVGLLRSGPVTRTGLLVTTGERLERFAAEALSTVPTDLLGLVRTEMGDLAWTLLSSGDLGTAAEIHSLLARAAQRTGRLDHAVNFYRAALSAYEEIDDRLSAANTLFRLGQVAEMRGQYSVARENYQLAVRGYALTEETRGVATGLQRLGVVTLLDRRPGEAMPLLERARVAFGLVHDSTGTAITLGYLGAAAAATGDPAAATEYLWRSQAVAALSAAALVAVLVEVAQEVTVSAIRDAAVRALPASALPPEWRSAPGGRSPGDEIVRGDAGAATGAATGRGGDDGYLEPPGLPSTGEGEGEPQIINIRVDERPPDSAIPLVARQRYTLVFRVGAPQPGNLGRGIREIPRSIIPPEGLETSWIVASTDVTLSPVSGQSYTVDFDVASAGDITQWMASFALTVPPAGDSDDRRLAIVPLDPGRARIDVSVCVHGDEYRRLTVELEVTSPSGPRPVACAPAAPDGGGGAPRAVTATEVHGPPLHQIAPRPAAPWQIPPKKLKVSLYPANAYVECEELGLSHPVSWAPDVRTVEGRIRQVREALDALRVRRAAYFEGVSPEELASRLAEFRPSAEWRTPADAQPGVAGCPEIRALADEGYLLYTAVFGADGDLRRLVDGLGPGDMLALAWHSPINKIVHIPWALMYREPPGPDTPIEPLNFLGLRLRINYVAYEMRFNRAIGETVPTHLMYWGDNADDPVAAETARHRAELQQWAPRVLPTVAPGKAEVLHFLGDPAPSPVGLVYVYSRALTGDAAGFRFADGTGADDTVTLREMGLRRIPDRPLVFANACGTAAASTYVPNEMEDRFFTRGCSAFVGTECRVPIAFAARFAAVFFHFLHTAGGDPTPAGEALAQARRFFLTEYGSLGGLFYSYVNDYYLFLASDDEVAKLSRHAKD